MGRKLELGSSSKILCRAQGTPTPVVRWAKEGLPLFSWPPHVEDVNGTLYFHGVQTGDAGYYTCIATNSQGLINTTIYVDVIGIYFYFLRFNLGFFKPNNFFSDAALYLTTGQHHFLQRRPAGGITLPGRRTANTHHPMG